MKLSEYEEEENYHKPVLVSNFWSNNYIEHLKDIITDLKKFDTQKIQLTIVNKFISSIDNGEECAMQSTSDNIEIMINDEADEVTKELFDSIKNSY